MSMTKIIPGVNFKVGGEYRIIRRMRATELDAFNPTYLYTKGGKSYFQQDIYVTNMRPHESKSYGKTYYFGYYPIPRQGMGFGYSHIRRNLSKKPRWGIISIVPLHK